LFQRIADMTETDNSAQIWRNARLAARADPADVLENAAIVVRDGRIEWFGAEAEIPSAFAGAASHDLEGRIVTPGLVDCHTHLVYAGNRAEEFAMRLEGASYEDIAKRGGGIVSTVRNTRAASEDELFTQSLRRLDALLAEGVTALEIKSGRGDRTQDAARCAAARGGPAGDHRHDVPWRARVAAGIRRPCR